MRSKDARYVAVGNPKVGANQQRCRYAADCVSDRGQFAVVNAPPERLRQAKVEPNHKKVAGTHAKRRRSRSNHDQEKSDAGDDCDCFRYIERKKRATTTIAAIRAQPRFRSEKVKFWAKPSAGVAPRKIVAQTP